MGLDVVISTMGSEFKCRVGSSDDEGSGDDVGTSAAQTDLTKPWFKEFNQYLDTTDELSDGQTLVQWWGVSACLVDVSLFFV